MTHRKHAAQRRGATLVLICILMVVLVALVAFAVDVGRMYLVRAQLQGAVDAGALAAALQLQDDSDDIDAAVAAAEEFVTLNRVGWLTTVPEDAIVVTAGTWDADAQTFTSTNTDADAVQVSAHLDDEPLFFSSVLGHTKFSVPRTAIAAAGGYPMDIIMTLDITGSMSSDGRIEALHSAAPSFVDVVEEVGDDDRIGVFGYGANPDTYDPEEEGHSVKLYHAAPAEHFPNNRVAVLEAPLTSDFDHLRSEILIPDTLIAGKFMGGTPIGAALRDSAHYLDSNVREDVEKVIVLMSDGHANQPSNNASGFALEMADYAASMDIVIYTISLGNSADEGLMQEIADRTGGQHFIAKGTGSELATKLESTFRHVANSIKRTQLVQ